MECEASTGCRVHTLVKREWTILMRTGREERRYEFSNCSHDCHPHNITFHLLLLLNLFLAPSIPIPTLQIISTHTFTICGSLLLCSSREPVSLSQHTLPRDICLSVRPSVSRVMCLSEAGKFNRNKRWSLAGRVFEPGTDKCDSLVVPPEVKKKRVKSKYGRLSHILYLLHDCSSML